MEVIVGHCECNVSWAADRLASSHSAGSVLQVNVPAAGLGS